LLWRLQHGELPPTLQAKVFWILIGTNDLPCSEEVISIGVMRIVDEVRKRRPNSKIVINGLLPRATGSATGILSEKIRDDQMTKWEGVELINKRLRLFTEQVDNVFYFDALDVFTQTSYGKLIIPPSLMKDFLHPTAQGYKVWGEAIVQALQTL
jgi:lysophospholipase L1-like esterase